MGGLRAFSASQRSTSTRPCAYACAARSTAKAGGVASRSTGRAAARASLLEATAARMGPRVALSAAYMSQRTASTALLARAQSSPNCVAALPRGPKNVFSSSSRSLGPSLHPASVTKRSSGALPSGVSNSIRTDTAHPASSESRSSASTKPRWPHAPGPSPAPASTGSRARLAARRNESCAPLLAHTPRKSAPGNGRSLVVLVLVLVQRLYSSAMASTPRLSATKKPGRSRHPRTLSQSRPLGPTHS